MEKYRKYILLGIILIALGVVFTTSLGSIPGSLSTVLIAVGGLFLIIGMSAKRKSKENES